jgi:AcrR family transcriptional regulator
LVNAERAIVGLHPPQQARSRRALEKVLEAAELVLARDGFDDFTMAAVAEEAGVSIGAIYRRFDGKEQLLAAIKNRLLTGLEEELAERLSAAEPSLAGVVDTFVRSYAQIMAIGSRILPDLLRGQGASAERGGQSLVEARRLFDDAVAPYMSEVRQPDPRTSVAAVRRTVIGACIHRAASRDDSTEVSWETFAEQLSNMAVTYLLTSERPRIAAEPTR